MSNSIWLANFLIEQWNMLETEDLFSVLEHSLDEDEFLTSLFILEGRKEELYQQGIDLTEVISEASKFLGYQSYRGDEISKASSDFTPKSEYKKWKMANKNSYGKGAFDFPEKKSKKVPPTNKTVVKQLKSKKPSSKSEISAKNAVNVQDIIAKESPKKKIARSSTPKKFYKVAKKYKVEKPYASDENIPAEKISATKPSTPKSFYRVLKKYRTERPFSVEQDKADKSSVKRSSVDKNFYKVDKKYKVEKPYSEEKSTKKISGIYKKAPPVKSGSKRVYPVKMRKSLLGKENLLKTIGKAFLSKTASTISALPSDRNKILTLDDPRNVENIKAIAKNIKGAYRFIKNRVSDK